VADCHRYGNIIADMKKAEFRKKDPLPKILRDTCQLLTGWHNNYGGKSI